MREEIKGIGFDLDGTLYPNYRFNLKLLPFLLKELRLLAAFGKARTIIRKEQEKNRLPEYDFYMYQAEITAKILSVEPKQLKEKIERLIYRGWEPLFEKVRLFKDALKTLDTLRKAGYKLGLLSDFPPEAKLKNLNLTGYWDAVLCSEQCKALKPHPISFIRLAESMDLPPEKILYVGNSRSYDIAGAASAGMKTAWIKSPLNLGFGGNKTKADFSFSNYRQLQNFMLN